jgi:hypothetical protein
MSAIFSELKIISQGSNIKHDFLSFLENHKFKISQFTTQEKELVLYFMNQYNLSLYFNDLIFDNDFKELKEEFYKAKFNNDIILNDIQVQILNHIIHEGKSVVLSAPTSFGKSLIIDEIVYSKKFKNIVIIVPTIALLVETRNRLYKYTDTYKIIFSSKQEYSERNIVIVTPERFNELDVSSLSIDFWVIDEFYKLSDSDEDRKVSFNKAYYTLKKMCCDFYMIGPFIDNVKSSIDFSKNKNIYIQTDFSPVASNEVMIYYNNIPEKKRKLRDLLKEFKESGEKTLIYCKGSSEAEKLAIDLIDVVGNDLCNNQDAVNWIIDNYSENWLITQIMAANVGVHHRKIPTPIKEYVIKEYNEGTMQFVFCTTTLIEGVNTATKNIVIYDSHKATKYITNFDYRNIKGRSGRAKIHYVGNTYVFRLKSEKDDKKSFIESEIEIFDSERNIDVNIPIDSINHNEASKEVLIQVDKCDLNPDVDKINYLYNQKLLSTQVIKLNRGVNVDKQLELAEIIQSNKINFYNLSWSGFPDSMQLRTLIEAVFILIGEQNIDSVGNIKRAYALTIEYTNTSRFNIKRFIKRNIDFNLKQEMLKCDCKEYRIIEDLEMKEYVSTGSKTYSLDGVLLVCKSKLNTWVNQSLTVLDRWFSYIFPKYISAVNNIQREILTTKGIEPGDYSAYASAIEFGNKSETETLLEEMGIPFTAIEKIYKEHQELYDKPLDFVVNYIVESHIDSLSSFDLRMIDIFRYKFKK